jgi:hypothetical protein
MTDHIESRKDPIVPIFANDETDAERRLAYVHSLRGLESDDSPITRLAEATLAQFMGLKRYDLEIGAEDATAQSTISASAPLTDDEWDAAEQLQEYVHLAVCRFIVQSINGFIDDKRQQSAEGN